MLNILLTGQVVCIIVVLFHYPFVFLHVIAIMLNVLRVRNKDIIFIIIIIIIIISCVLSVDNS